MIVLSGFAARQLLTGGARVEISLDLNLTRVVVTPESDGAMLAEGAWLPGALLVSLADEETACFVIEDGEARKVYRFSETTGRAVTLHAHPTGAPTMILAGFPMHRIKGVDPWEDTRRKLQAVAPVHGRVLDTATGLGYTAIAAAATAAAVTTIELDPAVLEVARLNPWSQPLFDSPSLEQRLGNAFDIVPTLADGAFDLVLHDPPTMQLAGELYSGEFYRQLWRVLSRRGRLFHYIGSPDSKHGASVTRGVVKRLHEAGFARVTPAPDAFGVVAEKERR